MVIYVNVHECCYACECTYMNVAKLIPYVNVCNFMGGVKGSIQLLCTCTCDDGLQTADRIAKCGVSTC